MKNKLLLLVAVAAFAPLCMAQGVRYDNQVLLDSGRPVQGAGILVCSSGSTGTPCTPVASIFSDSALSATITQPGFQSGAQGNYFFYAACNKYDIQITGNGITTKTMKDVQLGPCGKFNATLKRVTLNQGTTLVSGNFAFSGGWGTTASIGSIIGTDGLFGLVMTSAGTGQTANPTVTITFADGTWTNPPVCIPVGVQGNASTVSWEVTNGATATAVSFTLTAPATPSATGTYGLNVICGGR